jgi:hypothetical protein
MRMHSKKTSGKRIIWLAIALLLAAFSLNNALAFEASGGTITSLVDIGAVSANPGESHILGCYAPASSYQGGTLDGYFGLQQTQSNQSTDLTPPEITFQSPLNHAVFTSRNITFSFNASDISGLENCTLYIDSAANSTKHSPSNGQNNFTIVLGAGAHTWRIGCYDNYGNAELSPSRNIEIMLASTFDGDTTDLTTANLSDIQNLTIAKSGSGKIRFNTSTNLSGIYDLESHIIIGPLSISVDSSQLPGLDKPATLTMYNVPFQNVMILRDGIACSQCFVESYSGGTLVFDVPGFSTYTVTGTSMLEIFDDTDSTSKEPLQRVGFYANYTNVSSGSPISSTCEISFNLGGWTSPLIMPYNSSSGLYEYSRNFSNSGTYAFNVSCQASVSGFDDLSAIDYTLISGLNSGSFAQINSINITSTRYEDSRPAARVDAYASNVSEIAIANTMASRAWQGYFGNISGEVVLTDASGDRLYDWGTVSIYGEIMASRSVSINWDTIRCIDESVVSSEDSWILRTAQDADSVSSTFNMSDHPYFRITSNNITGCRSTRTFRGNTLTGFWNILLSDGAGSAVYTGLLSEDSTNFQDRESDFELIVPVPFGTLETYYLYLELN